MVHRSYQVGNLLFGIRTTSMEFCDWLDQTLSAYQVDEETGPYYSVVVGGTDGNGDRSTRGFHILYQGSAAMIRTLDLPTLGRALLGHLESMTFGDRDDLLYLEQGLVSSNGRTALVPAWTVRNLSALGRRVTKAGIRLPAVTWVAVDPATGRAVPLPETLDVPADAISWLENGHGIARNGDRMFVDGPVSPDLILTMVPGEDELAPISRGQALSRLVASVQNLRLMGRAALDGLAQTVTNASCQGVKAVDKRLLEVVGTAFRSI